MANIFLSYRNTPDRRLIVKRLAVILRSHGLSVWWDYGLEAGQNFRQQIVNEIGASELVITLWCQGSIRSKWVLMEAELGKDKLLPAKLQDVSPPEEFASIQAADLTGWDGGIEDPKFRSLLRSIGAKLNRALDTPQDLLEEWRAVPKITALTSRSNASQNPAPIVGSMIQDLRMTWENFPAPNDPSAIMRFLSQVKRHAQGTGLEFEVEHRLSLLADDHPDPSNRRKSPTKKKRTSKVQIKELRRTPNMVAICSGKGGVGKTWVAISIAHAAALSGKRVLLVDGDYSCANVDVQLGAAPETDLAAVIAGWIEIKNAIQRVPIPGHSNLSIDILFGRSGSGALAGLPVGEAARIAAAIQSVASEYDLVLIDTETGLGESSLRLARACAACIIVSDDEPASMTDAYALIKVLRGYSPETRPLILINRVEADIYGMRTHNALARAAATFLNFEPELVGVVQSDPEIGRSVRELKQLIVHQPNRHSSLAIKEATERLLKIVTQLESSSEAPI